MADFSSPLGADMSYAADLDPSGRSVSGRDLVANAILHRLTTDQLPLIDSDDGFIDYGEDVRLWAGAAFTQEGLSARAAALGPIVERDPRVSTADVTGTAGPALINGTSWALTLAVTATLRTGETISLVIGVSQVTVELLSQGR